MNQGDASYRFPHNILLSKVPVHDFPVQLPVPSRPSNRMSAIQEAQFHTLNFQSLLSGDDHELTLLLSACENDGFFFLDLRDWESGKILQHLDVTTQIMKKWFTLPVEEKMKTETHTFAHG